jgi:RNA polymerase sigma-70 factor (ECF subfamily)
MDINALYKNATGGDRKAEGQLFQELTESFRLYMRQRIQNEQDAEEVVQDVLLTVAKKYKGVEFKTSFAAWAYKIFEHKLYTYYRAKRTRQSKFVQVAEYDQTSLSYNPDPALKHRLLDCLQKIGQVNNRYAKILDFHFQGYSGQEVSERLGISKNSVLISLSRARSKLKMCLEKGDIQ